MTLSEKTSILLTLAMVFVLLGALGLFGMGALRLAESLIEAGMLILGGLLTLIYVVILAHLRKKGDMNVDVAVLPTAGGGYVEVEKKSSIWITIAFVFALLSVLGSLGYLGYLIYYTEVSETSIITLLPGIGVFIISVIYALILDFLRTKIDFPVDRVVVINSYSGVTIELYKSKSIWITIGMALTLLAALAMIAIGVLSIIGEALTPASNTFENLLQIFTFSSLNLVSGVAFIAASIPLLIAVAVLNFLRVRGHVRQYQSVYAPSPRLPSVQMPYAPPPPQQKKKSWISITKASDDDYDFDEDYYDNDDDNDYDDDD